MEMGGSNSAPKEPAPVIGTTTTHHVQADRNEPSEEPDDQVQSNSDASEYREEEEAPSDDAEPELGVEEADSE